MKKAYTLIEFGEAYGLGRSSVYKEIWSGRLKFFKVGTLTRISVEAAERWIRAREKGAVLDFFPGGRTKKTKKKKLRT